ncbi:MAG: helicase-related protein, partial [Bacteriovoracaceae bacterium]|nr:helicase-related protein [Bacteriovoracaceae bacterium]
DASEIDVLNTKDKIISHLIDTHGTGRMIFRNTRDHLEKYNLFFPKRVLHSKKIENTNKLNDKLVFDLKFDYLKECLDQNSNEKVLVIVHSKDFAIKIHERLTSSTTIKSALFYSEQSLMERDRQAAYFADDDGARVLICTEVGSEGRNFEFASHLFLFDIPKVPDLLEQRIGRLDRVGQKHDINIHIPYIEKSFEHILIDWYEKVFKSFEAAPKAATTFYNEYKDKLEELIKSSFNQEDLDTFISNMKVKYDDLVIELSKGHDALLDINSFNFENAKAIKNSINEFNQKNDLDKYMNMAFDALGITIKDLSDKVFFIKESDNALLRGLPGLNSEGMSGTLSKDLASYRSDISLFSFEHPLIVNLVETLTNTEFGNLCIVKQNGAIKPDLCFELIFKLQTVASVGSVAREFLPLTPIRVLLDSQGKDITKDYSKKFVDSMIDSDIKNRAFMQNIPRESIKQLTDIGQNFAKARSKKYITDGIRALNETYELEKLRLKNLIKKNPLISDNEILAIDHLINENTKIINDASITLDAIRIVVKDGVV